LCGCPHEEPYFFIFFFTNRKYTGRPSKVIKTEKIESVGFENMLFTRTYKPMKIATSGVIGYKNVLYPSLFFPYLFRLINIQVKNRT